MYYWEPDKRFGDAQRASREMKAAYKARDKEAAKQISEEANNE